MKLAAAFFRLVRWPNLVFIVITQFLFYYCVYLPLLLQPPGIPEKFLFFLLILSSVLIAAAGYIINDYFDLQIDVINKPDRIIINKFIKRRWAIVWHWLLSGLGILISLYISYKTGVWIISLINFLCVFLLWLYSITLKKRLLVGNVIISLLAAWVIGVVYFFAGTDLFSFADLTGQAENFNVRRFFKFTILYAGFAFIMTLIREAIKDMEDMEGDRKYGCNTMPICWGIPASKIFTGVWISVSIAALAALQLYAGLSGWWLAAIYVVFLIIAPLIYLLRSLIKSNTPANFHSLSTWVKLIMLSGILSMLLLKFA